ncbi:Aste57867_18692 [Aphanomyces stellatus]|uniref:Aste57867_18692 protein n=1 Tax=Aphanomyces stellatus TaxID=120398 RepID=A0A485LCM9_9STRA|nr:hypothetical protein As57867_018630 [Aphanomyces stellatus]VFT95427.1 Aste57867_18692 [Aphanomyces stellatus]
MGVHSAAAVVPKRLGLKYAPIPTLALEYQGKDASLQLAVVELPEVHGRTKPGDVVARVQKEHELFGPSVVNEDQLLRLLQQLIDHQRPPAASLAMDEEEDEVVVPAKEDTTKEADERQPHKASRGPSKEDASDDDDGDDEDEKEEDNTARQDGQAKQSASRDDREASDDEANDVNVKMTELPVAMTQPTVPDKVAPPPPSLSSQVTATTKEWSKEDDPKDESEFDESFEEESFVEESTDEKKGSFLTQVPSAESGHEAEDEEAHSSRGMFGSGVVAPRAELPAVSAFTTAPSSQTNASAIKTDDSTLQSETKSDAAKTADKSMDESADEIPSDEEDLGMFLTSLRSLTRRHDVEYFSGGDESGDDDGF